MLQTNSLRKRLRSIGLVAFDGTLFRVVRADVLYGFAAQGPHTPRPLFNLGSPRAGARYTPRGGAPSVYLAADMDTAMREVTQIAAPKTLAPALPPGALVTYSAKVRLDQVLDLTDAAIRKVLDTSLAELAEPWRYRKDGRKPPTHRLGAAAVNSGRIEAIRFRSTKGAGDCFVIFTDALRAPSFIEVDDPDGKLVERMP